VAGRTEPFPYGVAGFHSTYPFYDGGRTSREIREKRITAEITENSLEQVKTDVLYDVALSYCTAVFSQKKARLLESRIKLLQQHQNILQDMADYQQIRPVSHVELEEIDMIIFESEDVKQIEQLQHLESIQNLRLSIDYDEDFNVNTASLSDLKLDYINDPNQVSIEIINQQLQIIQSQLNVARDRIRIDRAKTVNNINISVDAAARYSIDKSWTVGVGFSWPILDFGEEKSLVELAYSNYRASQLEHERLQKQLTLHVEMQHRRVLMHYRRLMTMRRAIAKEKENSAYAGEIDADKNLEEKLAAVLQALHFTQLEFKLAETEMMYYTAVFSYLHLTNNFHLICQYL
jgi:outer membrane protein TolC